MFTKVNILMTFSQSHYLPNKGEIFKSKLLLNFETEFTRVNKHLPNNWNKKLLTETTENSIHLYSLPLMPFKSKVGVGMTPTSSPSFMKSLPHLAFLKILTLHPMCVRYFTVSFFAANIFAT